ncbi:hypothetical protein [Limnohabitans sp. 2KL-1]|uniref:hypothetical protein n=1 Tax=Limnohabitans sp. 2KL-1 TaxID=1100699 RepID=UPI001304AD8B|nr:hypothetical protein [Limnohabitans sp. 2KL-1]
MKDTTNPAKDLQAQRLRLHGLDVIEGRQGGTAFQKLVLTRTTARPSASARRLPMRR